MEWLEGNRGDNIAIKFGRRIYTVDKYGNLFGTRYKKAEAVEPENGTRPRHIEGLADLSLGYTYSISGTPMVVGKLIESNLFGYRFLIFGPDGNVEFWDLDYDDAFRHCVNKDITALQFCGD